MADAAKVSYLAEVCNVDFHASAAALHKSGGDMDMAASVLLAEADRARGSVAKKMQIVDGHGFGDRVISVDQIRARKVVWGMSRKYGGKAVRRFIRVTVTNGRMRAQSAPPQHQMMQEPKKKSVDDEPKDFIKAAGLMFSPEANFKQVRSKEASEAQEQTSLEAAKKDLG